MAALTLKDFRNMVDNRIEEVKMLNSKDTVYMRHINARKNIEIQLASKELAAAEHPDSDMMIDLQKMLLAACICDDKGNLQFDHKTIDVLFDNLSFQQVDHLYSEAARINFTVEKADIEGMAKN